MVVQISVVQLHSSVTENRSQLRYLSVENQGFQAKISHRTKRQSRSVSSSMEQKDNIDYSNFFLVVAMFDKYLLFSRVANRTSLEIWAFTVFIYFEENKLK